MSKVLRPQFEQYLHELQRTRPLAGALLHSYRSRILDLLEANPDLLVNKGSVTGHPEMRLDFSCSWMGANWDQEQISKLLLASFPGELFPADANEAHMVEQEDEAVILRFAVGLEEGFLAGRVRVLPS